MNYFSGNHKKLDTEGNVISVKSGTILTTGEWTNVRAGRYGQKLYLTVNGVTNSRVVPADNDFELSNISMYVGELCEEHFDFFVKN